mmetsp:Transcript_95033/g.212770  ORF Transcript_95033/g.212770 Transcript_95033/m.212770 type:complete len:327 (-) Transcript_95033:268-1248(-)
MAASVLGPRVDVEPGSALPEDRGLDLRLEDVVPMTVGRRHGGPELLGPGPALLLLFCLAIVLPQARRARVQHVLHLLGMTDLSILAREPGNDVVARRRDYGHQHPRHALQVAGAVRDGLRQVVHEGHEAAVHILLHILDGQVVGVLAERLVNLSHDEDQAPEDEGHEEADCGGRDGRLDGLARDDRGGHPMDQQHRGDELRVGEGERDLLDLPRVVQVHDAARELLENTREDRRGDLDGSRRVGLHNQALDPLHDHLAPVVGVVHEREAVGVDPLQPDDPQAVVIEVTYLLQRRAVQEAGEADEGVLEHLHLLRHVIGLVAEGEEP